MKARFTSAVFRRLPKSALLFASTVCLLSISSLTSSAGERPPSVNLQVLNKATGQPITTAKAGSRVRVVAVVVVPNSAAGAPISVDLVAKLKFAGVMVPYKIPKLNLTAANVNPEDGGTLVQSGKDVRVFKIPSSTPSGTTITLTANATVNGVAIDPVDVTLTVH